MLNFTTLSICVEGGRRGERRGQGSSLADFLLHPGETLSLLVKEPLGFLPLPAVQTPAAVLSGPPAEIRARTCLALGLRRQREPPSGADEHLVPTRARNGEPWASTSVGPGLRRPFARPLGFDFLSYKMGSVVRPTSFSFFIFYFFFEARTREHNHFLLLYFPGSPFCLFPSLAYRTSVPSPLSAAPAGPAAAPGVRSGDLVCSKDSIWGDGVPAWGVMCSPRL